MLSFSLQPPFARAGETDRDELPLALVHGPTGQSTSSRVGQSGDCSNFLESRPFISAAPIRIHPSLS
jgi:hypothetical protein